MRSADTATKQIADPGLMASLDTAYAPGPVRDRFLDALDHGDAALCSQLAANLTACKNPLPGMTCDLLGLPVGSAYGAAARHVLTSPDR